MIYKVRINGKKVMLVEADDIPNTKQLIKAFRAKHPPDFYTKSYIEKQVAYLTAGKASVEPVYPYKIEGD